jgi:hypothetical protein
MKRYQVGIAGALILAGAVVAANAQDKAATTPAKQAAAASGSGTRSIVGEVIDPACWVVNGAKGEAHKECAIACAKAGQILAILERKTNKVYLLVSGRPGEDPNKGLTDFIAQAVVVKGKVYTRGSLVAIKVASVEHAPKSGTR